MMKLDKTNKQKVKSQEIARKKEVHGLNLSYYSCSQISCLGIHSTTKQEMDLVLGAL